MATNSNESRGEQAMNVREITSGLTNELKLRNDPSAVGTSRTTSEPTPLMCSLQRALDLRKAKISPRNGNSIAGIVPPPICNSYSPSPSPSSDSSMSGGVSARMTTTSRNKEPLPYRKVSVPNISSTQAGPSKQGPIFGLASAGRGSGNVNVGVRNAQMCTSTVGRGKSLVPHPQAIGSAPSVVKEKKKRKRPSKKPPTQIIKASPDQFRAKVQELTGLKTSSPPHTVEVVRPQPVRTQPTVLPPAAINIDNDRRNLPVRPEPRTESSSPAMGSSVRCASPIGSDPAPVNIISYRDHSSSSGTSSSKSSLNYTMGYEQDQFPFPLPHQQEHLNPPDYSAGLPEEEFDYEDPTLYPENRTRDAVLTRSTFQGPEGNRKEEIANGLERHSGGNRGFGSGSAISDHSRPPLSGGLERSNRPPNVDHLQMEEDPDDFMVSDLLTDSSWIEHYT